MSVPFPDSVPVSGRGTSARSTTNIEEFVPEGDVDSFLEGGEEEEEVDEGGESEEEDERCVCVVKQVILLSARERERER